MPYCLWEAGVRDVVQDSHRRTLPLILLLSKLADLAILHVAIQDPSLAATCRSERCVRSNIGVTEQYHSTAPSQSLSTASSTSVTQHAHLTSTIAHEHTTNLTHPRTLGRTRNQNEHMYTKAFWVSCLRITAEPQQKARKPHLISPSALLEVSFLFLRRYVCRATHAFPGAGAKRV